MKKIQEKYGDQDEEERQLRLHLLAVISCNSLTLFNNYKVGIYGWLWQEGNLA